MSKELCNIWLRDSSNSILRSDFVTLVISFLIDIVINDCFFIKCKTFVLRIFSMYLKNINTIDDSDLKVQD